MASGIYLVTCSANGARYIGSSRDIKVRWWKHRYDLRHNQHDNDRWQNTWNKYGEQSFEWSVLEEVPEEKLQEREQHWIDILHPELNAYQYAVYVFMDAESHKQHRAKISEGQRKKWDSLSEDEREHRKQSLRDAWAKSDREERREIAKQAWFNQPEAWKNGMIERLRQQSAETAKARIEQYAEKRAQKEREKQERREARERARVEREQKRLEWEAGREERRRIQAEKLRAIAIAQWQSPKYRKKHQAATLAAMQDPEVLKRLSESHKGKKLSKEHRRKIGESGRGKKRSKETRRRLSEARKAWWARKKGEQ